ncbi:MAG: DUF4411 family protein [Bifidobacteriaceae bacterium]|jgi:predicted nucleic acid-binding protein|nr:DUF4411 family protein [Bifidobacteriaceae bacterium]
MTSYILDTNVFIDAQNRYYGFDTAPGFWDWLQQQFEDHMACSIEQVHEEISKRDDALNAWITHTKCKKVFHPVDRESLDVYLQLIKQVQGLLDTHGAQRRKVPLHRYTDDAIKEFRDPSNADAFVIAYAKVHNLTVVTLETADSLRRSRVKIPDACHLIEVPCVPTFQFVKECHLHLVRPEDERTQGPFQAMLFDD